MEGRFNQAEAYESDQSSYQRGDGLKLIELLAPEKGNRVLDIGCGTGKFLADLVGPEGKVVGVDSDPERLKMAREKYPADNLEYLEGTAESIPVENSYFDVAYSNYAIHWCEDKDAVFKQVAKKLKPGGKFGFVVVNWKDIFTSALIPDLVSQEYIEAVTKVYHLADRDQFQQIASDNKFDVLISKCYIQDTKYKNVSDLIELYMTHLHGKYGTEHFNAEAMKQKYGEGEFTMGRDIITCTVRLGCC